MAAFLVPRETYLLPRATAAIVARLWEVECLGTMDEDDLSA